MNREAREAADRYVQEICWRAKQRDASRPTAPEPDGRSLESNLGNALALVRLTQGKPNTEELRSIRLILLRAVLECRRLIECAKYVDETDDGLCPWDGLVEQEPPRPDVAVDLSSFELVPPNPEVRK